MCAAYCLASKRPQQNWIYSQIASLILKKKKKKSSRDFVVATQGPWRSSLGRWRFWLALIALSNPPHQVQSVRRWWESEQRVPEQWGIAACCNGVSQWAVLCLSVGDIASWKSAHRAQALQSWTLREFFFFFFPAASSEMSQPSSKSVCRALGLVFTPQWGRSHRCRLRTVFVTARLSFHRAQFVPLSCWVC